MTNTTLLRSNATEEHVRNLISFVNQLGVRTVGINALIYSGEGKTVQTGLQEAELAPLLQLAQECCTANGQQLIWYTPTQYCHFDPQALDLGVKGCSAARYAMCIEPNGMVLPCQSWYQGLGNILTDPWEKSGIIRFASRSAIVTMLRLIAEDVTTSNSAAEAARWLRSINRQSSQSFQSRLVFDIFPCLLWIFSKKSDRRFQTQASWTYTFSATNLE